MLKIMPRNPSSGINRRGKSIGDDVTIQLIQKPLSNNQWYDRFSSIKDRLEIEFSEMPRNIRVSKTFATLRALCLGPEVVMGLNVSIIHLVVW